MLIQYPYKHTTWISRWNDVEIHCFNVESMWCVCRDMFDNVSKLYLGIEKDFFKGNVKNVKNSQFEIIFGRPRICRMLSTFFLFSLF